MKNLNFTFFCLLLFTQFLSAQETLPILKSTVEKVLIFEGEEAGSGWWLTPEAKPDVYQLAKSLEPTGQVMLKTDIDSIKVELAPGQQFDFIVLFNGDTCLNRFHRPEPITKYSDLQPATHDTMPFLLTDGNNIIVEAILNGVDTVDLNFDSGSSEVRLMTDSIVKKTQLLADQPGVHEGTAKPNWQKMKRHGSLQIGSLSWEKVRLGATLKGGQGSDGRFAWDILDGRVIEIDYDKNLFIVHSSLAEIPEGYSQFEMIFADGFFHIEADLVFNGQTFRERFLFDGGYQRSVLLDPVLMKKHKLPTDLEVVKTSDLTNSSGVRFTNKVVIADELKFGDLSLSGIPIQIMPENLENPAGIQTHFLGNELLKRYNTILDLKNHIIWLKPNGLAEASYVDAN